MEQGSWCRPSFGTRPVWRAGEATKRSSLGTTQCGGGGSNRGGPLSRIIFWIVRIFESWKGQELQGWHFFRDEEKRESPFDFWLTPGTSCCMAACVGHAENASGTTSHTASSWGRQEGWKTWIVSQSHQKKWDFNCRTGYKVTIGYCPKSVYVLFGLTSKISWFVPIHGFFWGS